MQLGESGIDPGVAGGVVKRFPASAQVPEIRFPRPPRKSRRVFRVRCRVGSLQNALPVHEVEPSSTFTLKGTFSNAFDLTSSPSYDPGRSGPVESRVRVRCETFSVLQLQVCGLENFTFIKCQTV